MSPQVSYRSSRLCLGPAQAGHPVKTVAEVFEVHPNYLSMLRKTAREQGSNGLFKTMGRPVKLSAAQLAQARRWVADGVRGQEIARRLQVSGSMISRLVGVGRHSSEPVQDELPDTELPDHELIGDHELDEAVGPVPADAPGVGEGDAVGDGVPAAAAGSARLVQAAVDSRYAGAMLLHGFFDLVGAAAVFAPLSGTGAVSAGSRGFDDVALLTATSIAFALGVGSVEATKHLIRDQVGPLAGLERLPELRTLRPRLGELAQRCDPLGLQTDLARAMINAEAPLLGFEESSCATAGSPARSGTDGKPQPATMASAGKMAALLTFPWVPVHDR